MPGLVRERGESLVSMRRLRCARTAAASLRARSGAALRASIALIAMLGAACDAESARNQRASMAAGGHGNTTYEKYYPRAKAGDPRYQTLLGFMHFFGEGAPVDSEESHFWFHLAAENGDPLAHRNLAIMHRLGIYVPRDAVEARHHARAGGIDNLELVIRSIPVSAQQAGTAPAAGRGEAAYAQFCAGCHGLNGIAAFIESPSFALGERMDKPDDVLIESIRSGKGVMPSWGDKLPADVLPEILAFARGLERSYQRGIAQALRRAPNTYFLFGPMSDDDSAYRGAPAN